MSSTQQIASSLLPSQNLLTNATTSANNNANKD